MILFFTERENRRQIPDDVSKNLVIQFGFDDLGSDVIKYKKIYAGRSTKITFQKNLFRMIFYFCLLYEIESVYGQAYDRYNKQQNWNVPRVTSLEKLPPFKSNDIIGQE